MSIVAPYIPPTVTTTNAALVYHLHHILRLVLGLQRLGHR
jgi:hypothetical protein